MSIKRLMDELEGAPDPDVRSKALQVDGELYRLIVEGASDFAIFTLDRERRVLTWNAGAERLTGFAEADIVGLSADILFTSEDRERCVPEAEVRGASAEGKAEDDRWLVRRDGSRIFASGLMMALRDEAGQVRAFLKIFRDQTERERAGRVAEAAGRELEARVAERTAELSRALESLEREVVARERTELARAELLRRIVTVQEEERARISRQLHDEMGQHIAALTLELKLLRDSFAESAASIERLGRLQETTNQVGRELHRLAFELRPPALDDMGLEVAAQNYLEEWSERFEVASAFHGEGFADGRAPSQIETAAYRILQEALTNVAKHARATKVDVILERRANSLQLIVEDDGRGFDVEAVMGTPDAWRRLGLIGMKERVAMVEGTLAIESRPGGPTTLYARIPIPDGPEGDGDG